jgi:hypothetical protein
MTEIGIMMSSKTEASQEPLNVNPHLPIIIDQQIIRTGRWVK